MVQRAARGDHLALEVVECEVERWLGMHDAAEAMYATLPAEAQETIRRDGLPTVVHISTLVGTKPEVRRLAATILAQVLRSAREVLDASGPLIVEPDGRLSHPLGSLIEDVDTGNGAQMADEDLREEVRELKDQMGRLEDLFRQLVSLSQQPLPEHRL